MNFQRRALAGLALSAVTALVAGPAWASDDRGTKDEAKAMVEAAIEHIKKAGPEQAYKDFTTDKATWTRKDLYVMVYDPKGVAVAHGANAKLVGKDMSGVKDGNGKTIVPGMLAMAAQGGGWYDYDWPDPITKKLAPKSTYAKKGPAGEGFVGVGVYR
jgi:cytochrome c